VHQLPDSTFVFSAIVPARNIPDSFAVYVKHVKADGATFGYTLTTVAPDGSIISIEDKFR